MTDKLLMIVDMQYDFMDFEDSALPVPGASSIIQHMKDYISNLPFEVKDIVTTQDCHTPEHVEYDPDGNPFPEHCVKGTHGAELVFEPNIISGSGDSVPKSVVQFFKNEFDVWSEDNLPVHIRRPTGDVTQVYNDRDSYFQEISDYVDTVQVMGVAADVCVYFAVKGLLDLGFNVEVKDSLTRGIFKTMNEVADENFPVELESGQLVLLDN